MGDTAAAIINTHNLPIPVISVDSSGNEIGGTGEPQEIDLLKVGGTAITLGQKVAASSIPVVLASDQTVLSIQGVVASGGTNGYNPIKIGGVYNATQPTVTTGQIVDSQTTARGAQIVATGVDAFTVQPGNTANTTPWLISQIPATSGGASDFHLVALGSNNAQVIKASAGQLYGYTITNVAVTTRYVKLYNLSTTPNPASTPVFRTIGIPGSTHVAGAFSYGVALSAGIGIATVTGSSDTDNTAVTAGDLIIDIDYK